MFFLELIPAGIGVDEEDAGVAELGGDVGVVGFAEGAGDGGNQGGPS